MSLPMLEKPLEEVIFNPNDSQKVLLSKYKLENVKAIEKRFTDSLEKDLSDKERDEMLAKSEMEVKVLVTFTKSGGFARDFIYVNNALNDAYQSLCNALNDPSLLNIPWAQLINSIIKNNYAHFMYLVDLHQKDLRHVAQHIRNVVNGIESALKQIIAIAFNLIKEIFEKTLELVKNYTLPASLIAIPLFATGYALMLRFCPRFLPRMALAIPAYLNPISVGFIAGLGVVSAYAGISKYREADKKLKTEKSSVEKIGLEMSRDCIQSLIWAIETKKSSVEDGIAYKVMEKKLSDYRKEVEAFISPKVCS